MNDANRNKRLLRDDIINPIEVGQEFEERAKRFLESNGYAVKQWYSKDNWHAPCDMLIEKDGKEMYCEVRGLNGNKSAYTFTGQKMDSLTALSKHKPLVFVLIRKNICKIVSLDDLPTERYVSYPKRRLATNYYRIVDRLHKKPPQPTTTVKFLLSDESLGVWKKAKSELGDGEKINNTEALNLLVAYYNREKGRKLI